MSSRIAVGEKAGINVTLEMKRFIDIPGANNETDVLRLPKVFHHIEQVVVILCSGG